jgi:hypothetical protein
VALAWRPWLWLAVSPLLYAPFPHVTVNQTFSENHPLLATSSLRIRRMRVTHVRVTSHTTASGWWDIERSCCFPESAGVLTALQAFPAVVEHVACHRTHSQGILLHWAVLETAALGPCAASQLRTALVVEARGPAVYPVCARPQRSRVQMRRYQDQRHDALDIGRSSTGHPTE